MIVTLNILVHLDSDNCFVLHYKFGEKDDVKIENCQLIVIRDVM